MAIPSKTRILETCILPILTQTWTLTKRQVRLHTTRKAWRKKKKSQEKINTKIGGKR